MGGGTGYARGASTPGARASQGREHARGAITPTRDRALPPLRVRTPSVHAPPWRVRAPGVFAPLAYPVPFPTIKNYGWDFDSSLVIYVIITGFNLNPKRLQSKPEKASI